MLPVEWTTRARGDLARIVKYITVRNPSAATAFLIAVQERVRRLPENAELYREGRRVGTRELVISPNYLIVYRITRSAIKVIAVAHTRKQL